MKHFSLAAVTLFLVSAAPAQTTEGSYHFTTPQTAQSIQEAATIVRTVVQAPKVSVDAAQQTITFEAPEPQVAMAQWVLGQLDHTGNESTVLEYKSPSGDDVMRVNFLANVTGPQQVQEVLTVLRTVADIAKIFNFTSRKAIVIRAKPADLAFAEWLMDQLNLPVGQKLDATPRVYTGAITGYGPMAKMTMTARVNYLTNVNSVQSLQEMLTVLRTVGTIMKVFNYSSLHALALSGPDADIARAEWLIGELNQPAGAQPAGTQIYETPGADDLTRVFFLSNASSQQLNAATAAIRSDVKTRKVFYMTTPAAVVVRGTADQIAAAVQVMAQRNGLAD
jgi:hypothetical protein